MGIFVTSRICMQFPNDQVIHFQVTDFVKIAFLKNFSLTQKNSINPQIAKSTSQEPGG